MNRRTTKASHAPTKPIKRSKTDCWCLAENCGCWVDDYNQACDDWERWLESQESREK